MGLTIGSTNIPTSSTLTHGTTSLNKLVHGSTTVWQKVTNYTVTIQAKYNGSVITSTTQSVASGTSYSSSSKYGSTLTYGNYQYSGASYQSVTVTSNVTIATTYSTRTSLGPSYHEIFNGFYGYLNNGYDYDDFYTEFRFALPSGVSASNVQKIKISYDIVAFDFDGNYLDDFVNHYDDVIVYNNQTDSISEFTDLGYTDIIVETEFVGNEIVMSVIGSNYYGFNGFTGLDIYMVEAYY